MSKEEIDRLIQLLKEYATLPCVFECNNCDGCDLGDSCMLLYYVARYIKGETSRDKMIELINADYKNTKDFD